MFGLICKDTQAKTLALGKGLPTLDAVITKAEAEEQAKLAQSKLIKGMKQEAIVEVPVVEIDKAKLGIPRKSVNFATGQDTGRILMSKQEKSYARLSGRLATSVRGQVTLPMCVQSRRRRPRATPWLRWRRRRSLTPCSPQGGASCTD